LEPIRVDATTASNVQISVDWIALTTGAIPAQESDLLPLTATSPGPLTINHDPVCKITAPSMTAGEDYATAVLGNAWDMSHLEDIERLEGIATYQFLNGIFHATTAAVSSGWGDPQLWLHTGDDQSRYIDTDKYHYLTWRYWQEGVQDVGNGWVMRYLWTPTNFPDQTSTLNDVITLDGWPAFTEDAGWHTYSVDLKKASLEPGSPGWWGQQRLFRFDPTEAPASQRIHLDYILLTADAEADSHYNIEWDCWDPDGDELIMTLYFDNNQEGFNGLPITTLSTLPSTGGSGEPAALPQPETVQATWPYTVYLPSIRGGSGAAPCAEQCYTWTTSDVPEGTYYVHATVDDGYNVTQMYSEAPVIVDHSP
jgi:hypothetical protein